MFISTLILVYIGTYIITFIVLKLKKIPWRYTFNDFHLLLLWKINRSLSPQKNRQNALRATRSAPVTSCSCRYIHVYIEYNSNRLFDKYIYNNNDKTNADPALLYYVTANTRPSKPYDDWGLKQFVVHVCYRLGYDNIVFVSFCKL